MNLTEEQIEAVVNWMNEWDMFRNTAIPLRFKEAFTNKENTEKKEEKPSDFETWIKEIYRKHYLKKWAETKETEFKSDLTTAIFGAMKCWEEPKEGIKYIIGIDCAKGDDKSFTFSCIPKGLYRMFTPYNLSEIKIGDRVKLKGDSNSPEMTVTRDLGAEAIASFAAQNGLLIGKGVEQQEKMLNCNDGIVECNYFIADPRNENYKELRQHRFHKDALQKLTPVQPSNKK